MNIKALPVCVHPSLLAIIAFLAELCTGSVEVNLSPFLILDFVSNFWEASKTI